MNDKTMKPKKKAKQLYDQLVHLLPDAGEISKQDIQNLSLFVVDEVMNTINFQPMFIDLQTMQTILSYEYWEQVKQEINNL